MKIAMLLGLLMVAAPTMAGDGWSEYNTCPGETPPEPCTEEWLRKPIPYELGDLSDLSKWIQFLIADGHDPAALCYYVLAWDGNWPQPPAPMKRDPIWSSTYRGAPIVVLSKSYSTGVTHKIKAWQGSSCSERFQFLPTNHNGGQ